MSSEISVKSPRWQQAILKALEDDSKANVYQLATIGSSGTFASVPRVRSLIHRAFLAPRTPARPLLLTTTDVRTPKAHQLAQNARVELAWWLPRPEEQLRIIGTAHVLPSPDFSLRASGEAEYTDKEKEDIEGAVKALREAFPRVELGGETFDWEALRGEQFDVMSGHMRASWFRPTPGTRLDNPELADSWPQKLPKRKEVADEDTDMNPEMKGQVDAALRNFALVVIDPTEVDYVELGVVPNRRTRFFKNEEGSWMEEALVP
ncbi:hypothetical protein M0805_002430 [Coniferiporia weirii]|nr:hypothetical protein M0805_002430 [Coniferiporia weirii]